MLHVHARYLRKLERDRRIRRRMDSLPGDKEIAERRSAGLGLTVPEFAVLLAQAKISAVQDVLESGLPDDQFLRSVLTAYFPAPLRATYASQMERHPLRREIITTVVVNDMVNRVGDHVPVPHERGDRGFGPDISRAWLVAREVFDMAGFWAQVEALTASVDVRHPDLAAAGGPQARPSGRPAGCCTAGGSRSTSRPRSDFFADGVRAVGAGPAEAADRPGPGHLTERPGACVARGRARQSWPSRSAAMVPAYSAFDIVEIAASTGRDVTETAEVYFDLADRLQIDRLRDQIVALPRDDRWNTMARGALRDDLYAAHAALAATC